jgi:serine/threonine-protein kinase
VRDIGSIIDGRYVLRREVGRGGVCVVYEAEHMHTGRSVAVKLLLPEFAASDEARERILGEARALGSVRHPCIVDVLDAGVSSEREPFLVMEMLRGRSLEGLLVARRRLSVADTVFVTRYVANALAAVHATGAIHRDVKPGNVFVVRSPSQTVRVKLVDFGLVRDTKPHSQGSRLTAAQSLVGTAEYMAFEQLMLREDVGPRADIYALGVTIFECLTGQVPFVGSFQEVLVQLATKPPPRVSDFRDDVPQALLDVVARAMSREPSERFTSATEMAEALGRCIPERGFTNLLDHVAIPVPAPPKTGAPPPLPSGHRERAARAPYQTTVTLTLEGGAPMEGRSEDVSEGGIFVIAAASVEKGARVHVRFALPVTGNIVTLPAQVRWVVERAPHKVALGLAFLAIDDGSHRLIREYVSAVL